MVDIRKIGGDSLSTIREESTRSTSSTHAITNPYEEEFPTFPASFRGLIFSINADEPSCEGDIPRESCSGGKKRRSHGSQGAAREC
jgi:hypothetical protein